MPRILDFELKSGEKNGTVTNSAEDAVSVSAKLIGESDILIAEPDLTTPGSMQALDLPVDALLNRQWHLRNTGNHDGQAAEALPALCHWLLKN